MARAPHSADGNKSLATVLREQDVAVRTGKFKVLGRVIEFNTTRGLLRMAPQGFALARHNDTGALLAVGPWPDLVPERIFKPLPCSACAVKCDECSQGKRACTLCGGDGKPRGVNLAANECQGCAGSGVADCALCFGTGKMATGRQAEAPCMRCAGQRREFEEKMSELQQHLAGVHDTLLLVGPVRSFLLQYESLTATTQFKSVVMKPGEEPLLILEGAGKGSKVWLAEV